MRLTGMGTTQGLSGMSPRDTSEYEATATQKSGKTSKSRRSTKKLAAKSSEVTADAQEKSSQDPLETAELPIDGRTGLQLYENELQLTPMQKLQLRIAQERGIDLFSLKGSEYGTLKEYMKLEERKEQLNNFDDFFAA